MKRFVVILVCLLLTNNMNIAQEIEQTKISGRDLTTFSQNERWGFKDKMVTLLLSLFIKSSSVSEIHLGLSKIKGINLD